MKRVNQCELALVKWVQLNTDRDLCKDLGQFNRNLSQCYASYPDLGYLINSYGIESMYRDVVVLDERGKLFLKFLMRVLLPNKQDAVIAYFNYLSGVKMNTDFTFALCEDGVEFNHGANTVLLRFDYAYYGFVDVLPSFVFSDNVEDWFLVNSEAELKENLLKFTYGRSRWVTQLVPLWNKYAKLE